MARQYHDGDNFEKGFDDGLFPATGFSSGIRTLVESSQCPARPSDGLLAAAPGTRFIDCGIPAHSDLNATCELLHCGAFQGRDRALNGRIIGAGTPP